MTIEQRVAVLEEIFSKLQDYYTSAYSGEEIDARLASAGVPVGITKEYKSVAEMNQDFTGTDVQRGQFVLILPDSTASADYGKVYLKGTANWVYAFTLTTLTSIKGPIGPPGKNGVKGDPGEAGSSFAILGYFDTLDALKAAVPNPKAGDVYGVGTAPPYNIYIWDSVHGKWVANGNLQGPEGKQGIQGPDGKQGPEGKQGPPGPVGGSSNFVRYDEAQSLTDEQKAQARTNIGADTVQGAVLYTPQELSNSQKTQARNNISALNGQFLLAKSVGEQLGWYRITAPFSPYNTSGYLTVSHAWASGGASELLLGVSSAPDTHGKLQCLRSVGQINSVPYISNARLVQVDKRTLALDLYVSGTGKNDWNLQLCNCGDNPITLTTPTFISTDDTLPSGETLAAVMEYQNPPMLLGVEYKTTERFWGRPVYYKIVDCGQIADNKQVEHGIVNMRDCISFQGLRGGMPMPGISNNNLSDPWSYYVADVSRTKITLACGTSAAGGNCHVMLKYTKTTD